MHIIWFILMCIGIGVIFGVATGYFAVSALVVPAFASKPDMSTVVEKFGDPKDAGGKKRILIAYNTKNGCSVDMGLTIRDVLMKHGYVADLRYIPYIFDDDISDYDGYIVGGAIYWSMFMRETREFLAKNIEIFKAKPTALYMACGKMCNEFAPKLTGDEAKWRRLSLDYLEPMFGTMPDLKPNLIDIGTFAGNIYFKYMNLPEFMMMGLQMFRTGLKQGTYQDLDKVAKWANEIAPKFSK